MRPRARSCTHGSRANRRADAVRTRRAWRGRDGFTLIEVLVAFAVLATLTIATQSGVVGSIGGMSRAQGRIEAEMVARTLLTGPLGVGPAATEPRSGRMNGQDWRIRFEPLALPFPATADADGGPVDWVALRMIVDVASGGPGRSAVSVETVRLVRIAGP